MGVAAVGQQKRPPADARGLRVGSERRLADAPVDNDHAEVRHGRSVARPVHAVTCRPPRVTTRWDVGGEQRRCAQEGHLHASWRHEGGLPDERCAANDSLSRHGAGGPRCATKSAFTIASWTPTVFAGSTRLGALRARASRLCAELVGSWTAPRGQSTRHCLEGGPWQRVLPGIVMLFTGLRLWTARARRRVLLDGPRRDADDRHRGVSAPWAPSRASAPCRKRNGGTGRERRDAGMAFTSLIPKRRQVRSVEYVTRLERTVRAARPHRPGRCAARSAGAQLYGMPLSDCGGAGAITEHLSEPGPAPPVHRRSCSRRSFGQVHARGTAIPRAVLADVAEGVRSAAERAAKQSWPSTGLPTPRNAPV